MRRLINRQSKQAKKAIEAYPSYDKHDLRSSIVDIMTDLYFLAEHKDISIADILVTVRGHYIAEGGLHNV